MKSSMLIMTMLCLWGTTSHADMGFDQRYERDYNIFNPTTQYQPDNPLNPINAYDPNSAFNPLNPANKYNPGVPFAPLDDETGTRMKR